MRLYLGLNGMIESLHHGCLLIALTGKVLDTVAFHQGQEVLVKNFLPLSVFRRFGWRGFAVVSTCPTAAVIALASFELTGTAQANLENTSITVRMYLIPPICLAIPPYRPGRPATEH